MRPDAGCQGEIYVESLNEGGHFPHPVSVLTLESPAMRLVVHGRVNVLAHVFCLMRGYVLARIASEAALGPGNDEAELHMYLTKQAARDASPFEPPYIHFPTLTMHNYPWNSLGHEVAHFVSYVGLGGRAGSTLLEEAVSIYFAHPAWRPHRTAQALANQPEGAQVLQDIVHREDLSRRPDRGVLASFLGYVLEEHGLAAFARLWRYTGRLQAAIAATYGCSRETMVREWQQHLRDGAVTFKQDLRALLSQRGLLGPYQACSRCAGPLMHHVRIDWGTPREACHGEHVNAERQNATPLHPVADPQR